MSPDPANPEPAPRRRRGFSLIEATIAVALVLAAMATAVRALAWVAADRRALDRRAVALREADNLLDRLASGDPAPPALSAEAEAALPGASVEVERIADRADGVPLERIAVTVRYRDRPGTTPASVRLCTWVAPGPDAPAEDAP